jgi:hypothetical protein
MIRSFADKSTAAIIEDLATNDFSDVATGHPLRPVEPGDILLHDFII